MSASVQDNAKQHELSTYRDTLESIWVAIILAFVLRAFVVEAFVIPTGSMAPRLMGDHWDLRCPKCGYEYSYGFFTRDPIREQSETGSSRAETRGIPSGAVCPNCQFPYPDRPEYVNSGDRVLVLKYLYHFGQPQPWDVVVFKNPQDNRQNYIKRLIGLPGETIEIVHGDIFVAPSLSGPWNIRRKPQRAQDVMWQVVYDNDYRPDANWLARGKCPQWVASPDVTEWDITASEGRCFAFRGGRSQSIRLETSRETFLPRYGYNSMATPTPADIDVDQDVCTDLRLSFVLRPREELTTVTMDMTALESNFHATVASDGTVRLRCDSKQPGGNWELSEKTDLLKPGEGYDISLANVDFHASVRINGKAVVESSDQQYGGPGTYQWLKKRMETAGNHPIESPQLSISASGGPCEIWHAKVYRDVYYTSLRMSSIPDGPLGDYARAINDAHKSGKLSEDDIRYREVRPTERGWAPSESPSNWRGIRTTRIWTSFSCWGTTAPKAWMGEDGFPLRHRCGCTMRTRISSISSEPCRVIT